MAEAFPDTLIIVGAGVFGLSTALAVAHRHPSTRVTVIDRLVPPVEDGASVDTTRCIRADYADPVYSQLAEEAQQKIEEDPELSPYYFKQGMTFVTDGKPGPLLENWKQCMVNIRKRDGDSVLVEMSTPEAIYQRIHGPGAQLVPEARLNGCREWNVGYCNLKDAWVDAKEFTRVYYERCLSHPSISFRCGVAVEKVCVANGKTSGVVLENGQVLNAPLVLVAAGAWSNKLVYLDDVTVSAGIPVAWIKVTDEETAKWKNMSITTNLSTGLNLFPPYKGEMKCLLRTLPFRNTVSIPHPEHPSKKIKTSLPRTVVTNPTDVIPLEVEAGIRDNLRELMPELADRPFDRSKICWVSKTKSTDFIIAPHPAIKGLHIATGDSGHGFKFLTVIGDLILDSLQGKLDKKYADRWAWADKESVGSASFMGETLRELQTVVRSRL
ncbi:hypothetical protein A1O1_07205 [Capronia coronata CBS 617.96]|uniref:FAD dependent oxidoreductase domain-containing protein n=1 Tax=Capronia coronata CBS 617.96 TaxID=1182541 RepID=W9XSP6_9EURO|nr:uncharacterized protein A1O1_07205 [Capronia coronata CBS 617.96]EXJ83582.1 hypothetical protein A1O1_07205 [Capronia coronata CBS 617.96]